MNNLFKKSKAVGLDRNFSLETDKANGVVLVFQESRVKVDDLTGVKIPFIFKETFFFPTLGQALTKYIDLSQNGCSSILELLKASEEIVKTLQDFRTKFKNWD